MDWEEIRRVCRNWTAGERAKLRPLSWRQRAQYVLDYYWIWILGVLAALCLTGYALRQMGQPEPWFYGVFANTYAEIGNGSAFQRGFVRYAMAEGYGTEGRPVTFQTQIYCDPTTENFGNQYYRALLALLDGGIADAVVMERERLLALGAYGRLLDLEDPRTAEVLQHYSDRILYCAPQVEDYDKELVPVGIDLSGTALAETAYPGGDAVLGISASAPHLEETALFLQYLFSEEAEP